MPTATAPAEEAPAVAITTYSVEHGVRHDFDDVEPAGILGKQRAAMLARAYGLDHVTRILTHHPDHTTTAGPWTDAT